MSTIAESFDLALRNHQAGNLRQAELLYRQILHADPKHADSHHMVGLIAYQEGRCEQAVASIRQAVALNPQAAVYYNHLGLAYQASGQAEEAHKCFREALRIRPDFAEVHNNLGNWLASQNRLEEALAHFQHAVHVRPDFAAAYNNLGTLFQRQGKLDQAADCLQRALQLMPNSADAHNNLGNIFFKTRRHAEALAHYQEALRLKPDFADAHNNVANVLQWQGGFDAAMLHWQEALRLRPSFAEAHNNLANAQMSQGKLTEAVYHFREALRLLSDSPEIHNNLGNTLLDLGQLDEAVTHFQCALKINPQFGEALNNLGNARKYQRRFDQALACYDKALTLDSDHAERHFNRALLWLLMGNWAQGWPEYEWRWNTKTFPHHTFAQPRWDGSPLAGRTLLVLAEQGMGDSFQFIRYVRLLRERGTRVIFQCQPAIPAILAECLGRENLVVAGASLPPFDVYIPLLSLPGILGTTVTNIPTAVPYLRAAPRLVEHWHCALEPLPGFKIGIAWQGSPTFPSDRQRSIPLTAFAPLAKTQGVQLLSLQKGPGICQLSAISYQPEVGKEQMSGVPGRMAVYELGSDLDEAVGAFMDTAAIMKNLDLVITSDSAVAHLAGGLGVPVWVALAQVPDWRWHLDRDDSPWYPSMRLFRQAYLGKWDDVFERMAAELATVTKR